MYRSKVHENNTLEKMTFLFSFKVNVRLVLKHSNYSINIIVIMVLQIDLSMILI